MMTTEMTTDWRSFADTWEAKLNAEEARIDEIVALPYNNGNAWVFDRQRARIANDRASLAELREKVVEKMSVEQMAEEMGL